ncbi:MAG TPA: NADH-quinone oxidoreductase subunit NuoK [Micromonosporaceae bacterium]
MHPVLAYSFAAALFGIGIYGVLTRRNAVLLLMAVELLLNAVNLVLVTADTTVRAVLPHTGGVFALFVIVLAAAEVGVGLAIVLQLFRVRRSVQVDEVRLDDAVRVVDGPSIDRDLPGNSPGNGHGAQVAAPGSTGGNR